MLGRDCHFGDYVSYTPISQEWVVKPEETGYQALQTFNPCTNTLWKVWDSDDENDVVQLICARSIGALTLEGKVGYAKGTGALNRLCGAYVNPQYAVSGRSIGCTDRSIDEIDAETCTFEYMTQGSLYDEAPYTERDYEEDINWLRCSGLMRKSNRKVWLASRNAKMNPFFYAAEFGLSTWNGYYAEKSLICLHKSYRSGGDYSYCASCAVRPIVTLRPEVRFINGDGSKESPYELLV